MRMFLIILFLVYSLFAAYNMSQEHNIITVDSGNTDMMLYSKYIDTTIVSDSDKVFSTDDGFKQSYIIICIMLSCLIIIHTKFKK
jgi:hypothetical protein